MSYLLNKLFRFFTYHACTLAWHDLSLLMSCPPTIWVIWYRLVKFGANCCYLSVNLCLNCVLLTVLGIGCLHMQVSSSDEDHGEIFQYGSSQKFQVSTLFFEFGFPMFCLHFRTIFGAYTYFLSFITIMEYISFLKNTYWLVNTSSADWVEF